MNSGRAKSASYKKLKSRCLSVLLTTLLALPTVVFTMPGGTASSHSPGLKSFAAPSALQNVPNIMPAAAATSFSNPTAITVTLPTCGGAVQPSTPYPSNITVSGLSGTVSDVNVTFHGMNNFEGDFEIMLVGPGGGAQNLMLLSDSGSADVTNFTLVLDDAAASLLPQNGSWGTSPRTAKPTDYAELTGTDTFPGPAPAIANRPAPTGSATLASVFNGIAPNGTWSLYVVTDVCDAPAETMTGGWTIDITTASGAATTTTVTSSANPSITGTSVTFTALVTSSGSPVNTGTVTFTEGATTLAANVAVNGSGQASFSTSALTEGNHIITATYNGTASFNTSNGSVNQRVNNPTVITGSSFCNNGSITVNALPNPATPYPSNISVSGSPLTVGKVTVTLKNITHAFADDIDVLLVGPAGQNLVVLSDAAGPPPSPSNTSNVTVTLDDAAASLAPATGPLGAPNSSVTYKPTDYDPAAQVDVFPAPAPAPSAATMLSTFSGSNAIGTWSLYVVSDGAPDTGTIAGGWCVNIDAAPSVTINQAATQVDPTNVTPVRFTAVFSEAVTGFTGSDISFAGSTAGGTLVANVTGGPITYNVGVTGITSSGTVVVSIPAGTAIDSVGSPNLASTSTDNTVTVNTPTAASGIVTGRIVDNNDHPVEGAVVRLGGTQNRKFITDANGVYRFDNVETNGFYTVTPSRANYTFSPLARAFGQLGQTTEAAFAATRVDGGFTNPLDTPEYFVRRHYLDFLGREPDEAGFNFWSDQILECDTDTNCVQRRRENVSAAYFLSIEFQQTGGLVDALYRASYGARPSYVEFMLDTRAVSEDIVVGRAGWQAKLEVNKQAFITAFANRSAFHAAYDGLSNNDYVAALIGHTGVSFTSSEREALVTGLSNQTMTRADVLRSIADNQLFVDAKFDEAFVMMEYFGYLRRDPDPGGFAFWLDKFNQFGGNFEQAEMVKAFLVSGEYRDRFPR